MFLIVKIETARLLRKNPTSNKLYRVVFWLNPEVRGSTTVAAEPTWGEEYRLELEAGQNCRFLYMEVLSFSRPADSDPGTSTGVAVVGRVRIRLPRLTGRKEGGVYALVRLEGDGCIESGKVLVYTKVVGDDF
ncbi:hypothetical protein K2173_020767 [Erythroxylum novogranatense]|uniref:C2 domain-containing protein n=1 Tax=Erythroxylum novogranatense TaxID=1862640 RepID=A0AAV8TLL1_9ROSI|nr:hypothetical protein K2173_020767 [Erythroxylum novogranatense]